MRIISSPGKSKHKLKNTAVALGIFDGVHLGHQIVLKRLARYAKIHGVESVVITFYPHPQKEDSLSSLTHRINLISYLGVDTCVVINFTKRFSLIPAEYFVKNILVKKFSPTAVFVGKNFTFGKHAGGDLNLLRRLSVDSGFKVFAVPELKVKGRIMSSTLIRSLVRQGRLVLARRLLGRCFSVLGTVVRGSAKGRLWGVPTANIDPHHEVLPPSGIYVVRVRLNNNFYYGVCYIGRVFFSNNKSTHRIEVHIFDFGQNIYGKDLEVLFLEKIRDAKKFSSKQLLVRQIKKDIKKAKTIILKNRAKFSRLCPTTIYKAKTQN